MTSNQEFNSCMPWDMMAPESFNGTASTDAHGDDATGALVYEDEEYGWWFLNGHWYQTRTDYYNAVLRYLLDPASYDDRGFTPSYPQSHSQLPWGYFVPDPHWVDPGSTGVSPSYGNSLLPPGYYPIPYPHWVDPGSMGVSPSYHTNLNTIQQSAPGPASYDDWGVTPSYSQSHSQLPGAYLVQYPHRVDPCSMGVSPSYGNNHLPLNIIQQSAPNMYEPPYLPAPVEDGYYNANSTQTSVCLHPDLPLDEGTFSGMSNAVVGNAADTSISAPSEHLHRKAGKKGGKKGEVMTERVHDCAYDGKEAPLERGRLGYGKPTAIYQRLSRLKTEALDSMALRKGEAHGVDSDGNYICRAQGSILGGIWQRDERVCNKRLQDKDCYRRHLEEQHFGLQRVVAGKYVPIATRIRRALEDIERLRVEKRGRPTKKRKRASDEECVESSLSEREGKTKKIRRAGTA